MIEEALLNYGVLGMWTVTLLWRDFNFERNLGKTLGRFENSINKLTKAINQKL